MREFDGRKRVIIKRQPSIVSPAHIDNYSVDSVSIDSFNRPVSSQTNKVEFV